MSEVLRELEKSRQVVRKKYKKLRRFQGLAKQQITKNLEPLITPLRHLVDLEIKQENGGEQRIIKPELHHPQQSDEEHDSNVNDDDLDSTLADRGDIMAVTSTPQPKKRPLFTHGVSTLVDGTPKRFSQNTKNSLAARYMRELITNTDNDISFGPKIDPVTGKYMLGRVPFDIDEKTDEIRIGNYSFPGSVGLFELIFKTHPKEVEQSDEQAYAKIMQISSLHLNKLDRVKSNKGDKYMNFIKKLVNQSVPEQNETIFHEAVDKTFGGQLRAQYSEKPVNFVFWDDPNELVDRLELLIGEKNAGHNGVDKEIISILEELSEKGIIINSGRSKLFPAF